MGKEASSATAVCFPGKISFGKPGKLPAQGWIVRFTAPPKPGDSFYVEQNSIRKLDDEELHTSYWKVVEVTHELNLDDGEDGENPLVTLSVVVHPQ